MLQTPDHQSEEEEKMFEILLFVDLALNNYEEFFFENFVVLELASNDDEQRLYLLILSIKAIIAQEKRRTPKLKERS